MNAVPHAATSITSAVLDVDDPELPHVTIGDLGIVREVLVNDDSNTVTAILTPTYTGCPATEQIRHDVAAAIESSGYTAVVEFALSPAWTTDWITERGLERLKAAGIAPPPPVTDPGITPVDPPVQCPRCESRRTRRVAQFGSTACKASYVCRSCLEPFDYFKPF